MPDKSDYDRIAVGSANAAKLLDVSRPTLYKIAEREDFHARFKIGNRTLYSVEGLRDWVRTQTEGGGDNA